MIKTWQQRCEEHPDHQQGIVTQQMIQDRMQEEIDELRQALAQPEQEPVAWVYNGILHEFDPSEFATSEVKPLYTAPPKREWIGLTNEERFLNDCRSPEEIEYAIAIEAKLKEKNIC